MRSRELDDLTSDVTRGSLRVAVELWREHRAAELAELIGRTPGPEGPPLPRGSENSMVAWTQRWRVTALEDRGPLAVQLRQLLPLLTHRFAKATLQFISEQPADPRLADALAAIRRAPPATFQRPLVLRAFAAAMLVHADVRHLAVLDALAPTATQAQARALGRCVRALRDLPVLSTAIAKQLQSMTVTPKPSRLVEVEAHLWDAVYAAPAKLEPRAVLADALQEAGDARGEFISAQLQGRTVQPEASLVQSLLGPLRDYVHVESVVFKNGFPVEGSLVKLSTPRQQVALQCREWSTFERIEGLARLSPQLRSLKTTGPLPEKAVEEWVARRWPIPLRAVTLPVSCAHLVQQLPTQVETVEFTVFMDDVDLDEVFLLLEGVPKLKHVILGPPQIGTGEEWPTWSDAALSLTSLDSLTWQGEDEDLVFTSRDSPFDTLTIASKSSSSPQEVTMSHPAKHIIHRVVGDDRDT